MQIERPELAASGSTAECRARITFRGETADLFYRVPAEHAGLLSDRADAFVVALLIPAMAHGEDIHVAGPVSARLHYNLAKPVQDIFRAMLPKLRPVGLHAGEIAVETGRAAGVATGFSGGIDSYCLLADHHYSEPPAGYRPTHLLFNSVGSHGMGGDQQFRERFERLRPAAEKLGLPFVTVQTNLAPFYAGMNFQTTHTPRNASVALALQRGIGRYMYASTFDYRRLFIGPSYDMAYADLPLLPMLSTEVLDAVSVGSEYTRAQKTLRVADLADTYDHLDVCVRSGAGGNCSACWKCLRTLVTLEVAGRLDRYDRVFDFDAYRRHRNAYIAEMLNMSGPQELDLVELARQRGFAWPATARLSAALSRLPGAWRVRQLLARARR